jgi:hypothetical protein
VIMRSDEIFIRDLLLRIKDATKDTCLSGKVEEAYLKLSSGEEVLSTTLNQVTMDVQNALQSDVENTPHIEQLRKILYGLSDKKRVLG